MICVSINKTIQHVKQYEWLLVTLNVYYCLIVLNVQLYAICTTHDSSCLNFLRLHFCHKFHYFQNKTKYFLFHPTMVFLLSSLVLLLLPLPPLPLLLFWRSDCYEWLISINLFCSIWTVSKQTIVSLPFPSLLLHPILNGPRLLSAFLALSLFPYFIHCFLFMPLHYRL